MCWEEIRRSCDSEICTHIGEVIEELKYDVEINGQALEQRYLPRAEANVSKLDFLTTTSALTAYSVAPAVYWIRFRGSCAGSSKVDGADVQA